MSPRIPLTILILLTGNPCGAEIYKWRDAGGEVHYGERPPADGHSTEMTVDQQDDRPDPLLQHHRQRQQRFLESRAEERALRQRQHTETQARAAEQERACDQARDALRQLQGGYRLYTDGADGGRHYLSDEERNRAREEAHRWMNRNCR